jgi:predicted dehydrogenase
LDPMAFVNSNIHDYNDARWLLGDEAVEVTAVGSRLVAPTAPEGIESGLTTIRFRGGALGDIEYVSATRYGYDVRTEIVGDLGTIFIGSVNGTDCVLGTADGLLRPAMDHWLTRYGATYRTELEDWVRRMLAGEPPAVTAEAGRAALEIAVAAQRSLRSGRPVTLPLSPEA